MKLGIICPVTHLNDFAVLSNFHLVLPHLYHLPGYFNFYKERAQKGDFVLLDTSVFELGESVAGEDLIKYALELGASEMVAPEVIGDALKSMERLSNFLRLCKEKKVGIPVLAVTQGNSFTELKDYFFKLNSLEGVSSLGIPFDIEYENLYPCIKSLTLRRVLNRWYFVATVNLLARELNVTIKPTHLMGLSDGVELQLYRDIPWIRSNDSSSAFVHGSAGILYNDRGLPCEKISTKLDFNSKLKTQTQYDSVMHNIRKLFNFIDEIITFPT